jgi:MSHA biogenesis protein MshN
MLKDLDQRQVEQQGAGNRAVPIVPSQSNKKILMFSLLVIVLLNVLGLFVWQIYTENQALKKANGTEIMQVEERAAQKIVTAIESSVKSKPATDLINKVIMENNTAASESEYLATKHNAPAIAANNIPAIKVPEKIATVSMNKPVMPAVQIKTPIKKSSLTISRKQLSPSELAKQKVRRAEQALANNDIAKAEHLFEDVLLVLPEHKSARKQLAALWFGRKSYVAALNVLSQGIALTPNDPEFRVMQARIYLQLNKVNNAFSILNNMVKVDDVLDVEYQSLRATTAQQLNEFSSAVKAYQMLTNIEPSVGRWWLGLGIAYDSNGEFKKAGIAYKNALNETDLSDSAESFVRGRIIELGE